MHNLSIYAAPTPVKLLSRRDFAAWNFIALIAVYLKRLLYLLDLQNGHEDKNNLLHNHSRPYYTIIVKVIFVKIFRRKKKFYISYIPEREKLTDNFLKKAVYCDVKLSESSNNRRFG
jgi:hypothetical protein